MILQSSHVIVDCPICGRPLEMRSQLVSHEIACGHCAGKFVVYKTEDGSLATANLEGADLQERAEQLLHITINADLPVSSSGSQQRFSLVSAPENAMRSGESLSTLPQGDQCEEDRQSTVMLVEHRDEVFARLATDMAEFGIRVVRAKSVTEALKLYDTYKPALLVSNVDLPDQTGWLMTAKLRLLDCQVRVWLYQRHPSSYGFEIAKFLDVDALLAYQGDLFSLSETIVDRMDRCYTSQDDTDDIDRAEETTAA